MFTPSALIAGASIAGPALAYWLNHYGWRTTIVERAPRLRTGGQNVDLHGAGLEAIRRMGLEEQVRAAYPGELGLEFVGRAGRSSRESVHSLVQTATGVGDVSGVIHAAGVSPSQASAEAILSVDLYGTALVLEEFGNVIAPGGSGVVIASQSGHRLGALTAEEDAALAMTPADELLALPMLQPDRVKDSLHAYQLSKRGNSLRVMAEAVRWGKRGARVNTISPGIIITPLAKDELTGPRGEGYRRMIELCPAGRAGTPDEVGTVGALLMGTEGGFITGSDFLMDGGVTAAYRFGDLTPK